MPLIRAASGSIALSKASGPSSTPPVICPRSAILQSAAASMVDGILDVTVSTAERIATRGVPRPTCGEQVDRVLDDVALGVEVGEDVDRRVGDEQRLRIGRHIHDEDMADPPRRAQAGLADAVDRPHQLVGVQAALHQQLALALVDQLDGPRGRGFAVRRVDDLETADVEAVLTRDSRDLRGRPDQDRNDDAGLGRLDSAAQRGLVARDGPRPCSPAAPAWRGRSGDRIWRATVRRSDCGIVMNCLSAWSCRQTGDSGRLRYLWFLDSCRPAARERSLRSDRGRTARQPAAAASPLRRDLAARAQHLPQHRRRPCAALSGIRPAASGNGRERRLLIDQQHEELLAHERLEFGQRAAAIRPPDACAQAANGSEPAFVSAAARHADIEQARGSGIRAGRRRRCAPSARRSGVCSKLAMQRVLAAFRADAVSAGSMPTAACSTGEP